MTKICPKCSTPHVLTGKFCSRKCANSRTWSEKDKQKKSTAAASSLKVKAMGDARRKHPKRVTPVLRRGSPELLALQKMIAHKKWEDPDKRRKASIVAKNRGLGGIVSRRTYPYFNQWVNKTLYLHSSYEVMLAEDLDEHQVRWTRPNPFIWTDKDGVDHRYYPDFELLDHRLYLDPKNDYLAQLDSAKIKAVCEQNNVRVVILTKEQCCWEFVKTLI